MGLCRQEHYAYCHLMFWNYTETWIILANVPKSNEEWAVMESHSFACIGINVFLVFHYTFPFSSAQAQMFSCKVQLQGCGLVCCWSVYNDFSPGSSILTTNSCITKRSTINHLKIAKCEMATHCTLLYLNCQQYKPEIKICLQLYKVREF